MAKIGFIGTGIMGNPMAQNLQKAGHSLFVSTHHDAAPANLVAAGAVALANPKEVARKPNSSSSWSRTPRRSNPSCSVRTALPKVQARTKS